ncbi:ROK family protein [Streptomyces sp. SID3343]|uniref:ROK family protein n=1 Tax=Streptomyces sp. SID3343 TaxID=2690260 RepID=UPI00136DAD3C|nr:ROK family protein [Streptomyces sp. SID3343]MYW03727.1 ROK family protein [Streptomyces sp. SID3343]
MPHVNTSPSDLSGADCVVALDVGGTDMKGGVVDPAGRLVYSERRSTGRTKGPNAVVSGIVDFAAELRDRAVELGGVPRAAGVAVPGIVDDVAGLAVWSASIQWREVPLRALVTDRLDLPAALSHDVRTGALAEGRLGAGHDCDNFLFVAIGTGLASVLVLNGRPYPGAHGQAGEIGHITVRPGVGKCTCGAVGCLEAHFSGPAIAHAFADAAPGDDPPLSAAEVVARVAAGDRVAAGVWGKGVSAFADGLLTGLALYDPRLLVIGGGLSLAGEQLFNPLRTLLAERAVVEHVPPVVTAALGDEAGCRGAGLIAWDALEVHG